MIPSSRAMLSRDIRLPLDTCNTSGSQENGFENQFSTFDSLRDHPQGTHPCAPQREQESVPQAAGIGTLFARDDKQNKGTIPMPTLAGRSSTMCSSTPVDFPLIPWLDSKDSKYRNCNSTNFLVHNHFWFGRYDSKIKWPLVPIFPPEAMLWIKEVEMVDSFLELKCSRSGSGNIFQILRC